MGWMSLRGFGSFVIQTDPSPRFFRQVVSAQGESAQNPFPQYMRGAAEVLRLINCPLTWRKLLSSCSLASQQANRRKLRRSGWHLCCSPRLAHLFGVCGYLIASLVSWVAADGVKSEACYQRLGSPGGIFGWGS